MSRPQSFADPSEHHFRDIVENASVMVWASDVTKECVYFNDAWLSYRGRTMEEERGSGWTEGVHPEDLERCMEVYVSAFERRVSFSMEYRLMHRDGTYHWIRDNGDPAHDRSGEFLGYVGSCFDIDEQRKAIDAVLVREAQFRTLVENVGCAVMIYAMDGTIRFANQRASDLLGLPLARIEGHQTSALACELLSDDGEPLPLERQPATRVLTSGEAIEDELMQIRRHAAGDRVWVLASGYLEQHPDQSQQRAVMTYMDITPLKTAQLDLETTQQRLSLAAKSAGLGIWDWDVVNDVLRWDDRMFEIYGIRQRTKSTVQMWQDSLHDDDREHAIGEVAAALTGKRDFRTSFRIVHPGGLVRHVDGYGMVIRDDRGAAVRMLGVNFDSTERHRSQQKLIHTEKMHAIGQLVGGITHDFNNLLMGIGGCIGLALRKIDPSHPVTRYLEASRRALDQGAKLARQLLTISGRREAPLEPVDIDAVIEGMNPVLRSMLGEEIELRVRLQVGHWQVSGVAGHLEQILLNLVKNGKDAMPEGGVMRIETEQLTIGETSQDDGSLKPGDYLVLRVADTGVGMDEFTQEHIFEPFFTTKELGSGTGLGLATVRALVEQSDGHVEVRSELGEGTTFVISWPRLLAIRTNEDRKVGAPPPAPPGAATVLLVEDEPLVRLAVQDYLEQRGHTVLVAADMSAALLLLQRHQGPLDLLVSDVMLPGTRGRQVAEEVARVHPGIPVVFMSAHPREQLEAKGYVPRGAHVLSKPFGEDELLSLVDSLVAAKSSP